MITFLEYTTRFRGEVREALLKFIILDYSLVYKMFSA